MLVASGDEWCNCGNRAEVATPSGLMCRECARGLTPEVDA